MAAAGCRCIDHSNPAVPAEMCVGAWLQPGRFRKLMRVSFAVPVRNAESTIPRCVDSILSQTLQEIELVISDNASTDGTRDICLQYAARDSRVRYHRNDADVGVLENFNRLVSLARGEYFRWIGADDWLEPEYASACVAALDAHPRAIGVTTFQAHWDDAGQRFYREYHGPRVDSARPHERFARMLWFLQADQFFIDPIYTLYRRDKLASTRLHRVMVSPDRILAAELSLVGPYCHVERCLANRHFVFHRDPARFVRPPGHPELDRSAWDRFQVLRSLVRDARLTPYQRAYCDAAAFRFFLKDAYRAKRGLVRERLGRVARRVGFPTERLRRGREASSLGPRRS